MIMREGNTAHAPTCRYHSKSLPDMPRNLAIYEESDSEDEGYSDEE